MLLLEMEMSTDNGVGTFSPRDCLSMSQRCRLSPKETTSYARQKGSSEPLQPSTPLYVLQHEARDFTLNTSPKRPPEAHNSRPTSYVPTHAAVDFSLLNVTPKISPNDPFILQYAQESQEVPNVRDEVRVNPKTGMREKEKEKAVSISQRSKVSSRRSVVEKMGVYFRPARPGSVYSQNTGYGSVFGDGVDRNSVEGKCG
jgi:hypothetical protein